MRVGIFRSARDLPVSGWDALSDGDVYAGSRWVRYQETDPQSDAWYVTLANDEGDLLAATPVWVVHKEANDAYDPATALGAARTTPHALAGGRRGYRARLLLAKQADAEQVLTRLLEAVHGLAAAHGAPAVWWMYLDLNAAAYLQPRAVHPVPWLLAGDCTIRLPGTGFEDYLAAMSPGVRRRVRHDRNLFRRAGYTTTELPLSECHLEFARLVANLERRHGKSAAPEPLAALFELQAAAFGEGATVDACFRGDRMVAANLRLAGQHDMVSRACGFDYEHLMNAAEYFELVYYRAIEAAYRHRSPRLGLGIGTYETKIRRGAQVDLRWAVATSDSGSDLSEPAVRMHNRRRRERLVAIGLREEALAEAPPSDWW